MADKNDFTVVRYDNESGGNSGQINCLKCDHCEHIEARIDHMRGGDKSGLARFGRMKRAMQKHIKSAHFVCVS